MRPRGVVYPRGWVLYPRRLLAFAGDPSRGGIRTGAIHYLHVFTYRLVESLWSSLTLISEFYDTLGETLATSLVTPTIAFFLSYKVENWLVFYQNPRHVDAILVKNYYDFFVENLGIDSTRDRYRESNFSPFASILKKKLKKKIASCT